jgi:serine/threonine protein kinase
MQDGTTGTVVGKQSYLPPEQFRGQAEPASDLYAMGATLYYLLTGKDPTPISTIHIAQELPDIDASLDKLLTKLTALDPNNRTDATTGSDNQTNKST